MKEENDVPCTLLNSGWFNHQIDTRQINRRKLLNFSCMYIWGFHKNMKLRAHWAVKTQMPPGAKEKGEFWFGTLKGRKASHMEMEMQMFGKEMFAEPSLTMGHSGL